MLAITVEVTGINVDRWVLPGIDSWLLCPMVGISVLTIFPYYGGSSHCPR